jgi:hypothetical protein
MANGNWLRLDLAVDVCNLSWILGLEIFITPMKNVSHMNEFIIKEKDYDSN